MEVQQARAFLTVAEELHFGRAAERLGMAQPPLSRAIRALENDLGVSLFARTTRNVSLTAAGQALLEPARRMVETDQAARTAVHNASTGQLGHVHFGFSSTSSKSLAAALVTAARRTHPGITFDLHSTVYAEDGIAGLVDGTLDLALVRWDTPPPGITGRPVLLERPAVAVPRAHRLAKRTSIHIAELADEGFVMLPAHPNSSVREMAMRLCVQAGFSPRIAQEAPDSQTITALVSAGLGVTITADSVITGSRAPDLVTVPIDDPDETTPLYLAYATDRMEPALTAVLTAAEKVLPTVTTAPTTRSAATPSTPSTVKEDS